MDDLNDYTDEEGGIIRSDLRAVGISENIIEYVISSCRMAYAVGAQTESRRIRTLFKLIPKEINHG